MVEVIPVHNIMSTQQWQETWNWLCVQNSSPAIHPAYDALKLLEEVLELCYACGASDEDIGRVVIEEGEKAAEHGPYTGLPVDESVSEEFGDVALCLAAFQIKYADLNECLAPVDYALAKVKSREWVPDERTGVLRRPR